MKGSSDVPAYSHFSFFLQTNSRAAFSFTKRILFSSAQGADDWCCTNPLKSSIHSLVSYSQTAIFQEPEASLCLFSNCHRAQIEVEKAPYLTQLDFTHKTVINPARAHLCYLKTFPTHFCFVYVTCLQKNRLIFQPIKNGRSATVLTTRKLSFLFLIFCEAKTGHITCEPRSLTFFLLDGDAKFCPNSSCSAQRNLGTCSSFSPCQQSSLL